MKTQTAIVVSTLIIAVVLAITTRWEVSGAQAVTLRGEPVYHSVRLDRWTGAVRLCRIRIVTTECD